MSKDAKTWIITIDNTLVPKLTDQELYEQRHVDYPNQELLPGMKNFFNKLGDNDRVIFITSRREIFREMTEQTLDHHDIAYMSLLMDMPENINHLESSIVQSYIEDTTTKPIHKDKELLAQVHEYFGRHLCFVRRHNHRYYEFAKDYTLFTDIEYTENKYVKILKNMESVVLHIINELEKDYSIDLNTDPIINFNDLRKIFNIDDHPNVKSKFKDRLAEINILDMKPKFIVDHVYICKWPHLERVITCSSVSNEDRKDFMRFCFDRFDKIIKKVIYRIKKTA